MKRVTSVRFLPNRSSNDLVDGSEWFCSSKARHTTSTWLQGRQWGQMVSHLYYETILRPDQTAVTRWFIWPLQSLPCPDTSPDSQPSPSCLQGACFLDRLQELNFIPAECIRLQLLLPPSHRVRSLSAWQLTVDLLLENVSVRWRAPILVMGVLLMWPKAREETCVEDSN